MAPSLSNTLARGIRPELSDLTGAPRFVAPLQLPVAILSPAFPSAALPDRFPRV
jgi:hypothetical protein